MSQSTPFTSDVVHNLPTEDELDGDRRPSGPIIILPSPLMRKQRLEARSSGNSPASPARSSFSETSPASPSLIDDLVSDDIDDEDRATFVAADVSQFSTNVVPRERAKVPLGPGRGHMDWLRYIDALPRPKLRSVSAAELSEHMAPDNCWVSIEGLVFDVSDYLQFHPGGRSAILANAGADATDDFMRVHHFVNYKLLLEKHQIGKLE